MIFFLPGTRDQLFCLRKKKSAVGMNLTDCFRTVGWIDRTKRLKNGNGKKSDTNTMTDESADSHFFCPPVFLSSVLSLLVASPRPYISHSHTQAKISLPLFFFPVIGTKEKRGSTPCFVRDTAGGRQQQPSKKRFFSFLFSSLDSGVRNPCISQGDQAKRISLLSMTRIS